MSQSFGATSTTDEVLRGINLRGKRALVTGVSAGIGIETARALAAHGAQVIGAARDLSKAQAATEQVREQAASGGSLDLVQLDLASLDSVRRCADGLLAAGKPFDLIIANAGVMACPKGTTVDGFETQFGTNHLGHFVLVNRIVSLLKAGSRLVNLSSAGHRYADVDLEDPNFEHTPYEQFIAYGRSKTANVLFAVEFDRRHKARGARATAVHPGGIRTELSRHLTPDVLQKLIAEINASQPKGAAPFSYKSIPQGAATSVWAACVADAEAIGGRYCEDCHVAEVVTTPGIRGGVQPYALDPQRAQALWQKSEEMVGERFN
jgi:NAD(P)-dependent dehydrogenase (short-subunit alcohol dehydrogenase family)